MSSNEVTHKQSLTLVWVIAIVCWVIMPLTAWCILAIHTLTLVDHGIGILSSLALVMVLVSAAPLYRGYRKRALLCMLTPSTFPIVAYLYRVFF